MFLMLCMLVGVQMLSAQIITSAQVGKVKKEKKVYAQEPHEKGWRGFVEAAYSVDVYAHSGLDIVATYGYQINNWIYVGAGGGFMLSEVDGLYADVSHQENIYDDFLEQYGYGFIITRKDGTIETQSSYEYDRHSRGDGKCWQSIYQEDVEFTNGNVIDNTAYNSILFSLPLYVNARFFMTSTKVKPFADVKLGGMIPLGTKELFYEKIICEVPANSHYNARKQCTSFTRAKYNYGGVYFQLGFGAEYRKFSFSFNYALKGYTAMRLDDSTPDSKEVVETYHGVNPGTFTFNFGYSF